MIKIDRAAAVSLGNGEVSLASAALSSLFMEIL